MSELIEEGVTGFLVADATSAVAAVERAAGLDRVAIRARAVSRFGVGRMVDAYLAAYDDVVGRSVANTDARADAAVSATTPLRRQSGVTR